MAALADRDKYESDFARRVARLMGRHRRELEQLLGDPPQPSNVPESFWEKVRRESEEEFFLLLLLIFDQSRNQHRPEDGFAQFQTDRISSFGNQWSGTRARELGQGYSENSRKGLERLFQKWQEKPQEDPGATQPTKEEIGDDLIELFGPTRAEGIAISETTDATSAASEITMREAGKQSENDLWRTSERDNVCPICQPLNRKPRSVWSLKFPNGPKAHPRCNCWIEYAAERGK